VSVRAAPAPARSRTLERLAVSVLDRALAGLEGGTLEVVLPGGEQRRFGSGAPVRLTVHDHAFFARIATRGKLGLGESYAADEWEADDLVAFFELLLRNADTVAERHPRLRRLLELRPRLQSRNGLLRSRRNIAYHYDLGNELFALMLDETMTYSCAVFERPELTLAEAQRAKLERLCGLLDLGPEDHVLEIGCGWGSFARHAAETRGCRITGITISHEQAVLARERTQGLSVEILEQDYRDIDGLYTKVVSIEMLEAIGADQFGTYFATIDRVLAPGGRAAVQTILVPDQRWRQYRSTPDWIERYIFPGCLIPSLEALTGAATRHSRLGIYGVDEIGEHYAETLHRWRECFHAHLEDVRRLGYDRRFERTWDFYLAFCEAAFRTRALRDVQLLLARPGSQA
jgi:cyclopropane-fatty-acyl-phospholipid synthase